MSRERKLDNCGLEGLPLQLTIVAIVLAISSPIIYNGFKAYETGKIEAQLGAEAGAIGDMAKLVYTGGVGNAQHLKVSLRGGATSHADYLLVGDNPGGPYQCCVRYRAEGSSEQSMVVKDPNVPMRSPQGGTLKLLEGNYDLMIECKSSANATYVEVRTGNQAAG